MCDIKKGPSCPKGSITIIYFKNKCKQTSRKYINSYERENFGTPSHIVTHALFNTCDSKKFTRKIFMETKQFPCFFEYFQLKIEINYYFVINYNIKKNILYVLFTRKIKKTDFRND